MADAWESYDRRFDPPDEGVDIDEDEINDLLSLWAWDADKLNEWFESSDMWGHMSQLLDPKSSAAIALRAMEVLRSMWEEHYAAEAETALLEGAGK
jgi:hypothetical protein